MCVFHPRFLFLGMPEGPTLRRFSSLVRPFVSQLIVKVGGSTKQIKLPDLMGQHFINSQVHGKNLYLAFGPGDRTLKRDLRHSEEEQSESHPAASKVEEPCSLSNETLEEPIKVPDDLHVGEPAEDGDWSRWLRFHFGLYGSVRANEFSRARKGNKKGDWRDPSPRLILHFESGGFLVFYNCRMMWCSSPVSDPACDILCSEFDKERALRALAEPRPICISLMDQRHFSGVGNIIKNEVLFLAQVHPLSFGSLLPPERLQSVLDHTIRFTSSWLENKLQRKGLHYHIYMKERCDKGHEVEKEAIGPAYGLKRLTWYCPECQPRVKPKDAASSDSL
uniref:Endonuclease 8-like 2 n=1 Tax=Leptobrachium leishanense TaxID=445787 RepID=A0A8C5MKY9_9ANUR